MIEAMKQALEALEDIFGKNKVDVGAINALRQAIAEAEKAIAEKEMEDKRHRDFLQTLDEAIKECPSYKDFVYALECEARNKK